MTLKLIKNWSFNQLYYGKFLMTLLFSVFYAFLSVWLIYILFKVRKWVKYTLMIFSAFICVSFLIYLSGYLYNDLHASYDLARHIIDMVQSPYLVMALILLIRFSQREEADPE